MITVKQLFELALSERNMTANELGAILNVSRMTISRYRNGGGMDDLHVIKCAEMAGVPVPYAIACANAERLRGHPSRKLKSAYNRLAEIADPAFNPLAAKLPKKRGPKPGTVYKSKPGPRPGSKWKNRGNASE